MNGKKIIIIGCGGCLTLVLITGVLIGLFAYNLSRQMQHFGDDMHAMEQTMQRMREAHPFTPPEDGVISPERYAIYLDVRDAAGVSADAKLSWLVTFVDEPESKSTFRVIYNFIRLVFTMLGIQQEIVENLKDHEMSMEEYSHYTLQAAAQLHQWSEQLDENNDLGEAARHYFVPLKNLNTAMQSTGAQTHDLEALNYAVLLNRMNRTSLQPDNAALIEENLERFTRSRALVFMDSWIINFDVSEWRREMDFHHEDADEHMDDHMDEAH